VIGIPDDHWEESVRALLVSKPGERAIEEDIVSICKPHLTNCDKPCWIEFRHVLPKCPEGKMLKRLIRDDHG